MLPLRHSATTIMIMKIRITALDDCNKSQNSSSGIFYSALPWLHPVCCVLLYYLFLLLLNFAVENLILPHGSISQGGRGVRLEPVISYVKFCRALILSRYLDEPHVTDYCELQQQNQRDKSGTVRTCF